MDSGAASTNSGRNREGEDMSQTVKTLTSVHSSSPGSNPLDALTLNIDRRNESCRTNVAVTSAHLANSLTATGRCRCGRDFIAIVTLDSSHKPTLEGTMPHIETPPQITTASPSKRRRVDNVVDQIFDNPESQELALLNNDNKSIIDRSNSVNSLYNAPGVPESQQLFNFTRQHGKQRFDQPTNNNLASDQLNTGSICYLSVNTESPGIIVNKEMNNGILNGLDGVSLRHGQLKTGESPSGNFEGNNVPDQPSIPSLKRNASSMPPSCRKLLAIHHRDDDNVAAYPYNRDLMHELYFETQKTNRRDHVNLHWINDIRKRGDRSTIPSNDGTQTNHLLPAPVEGARPKNNKVIPIESINTQSENAVQIGNVTVQNNNPYHCFVSGYAHHRIINSTSSPQRLSCNDNLSQCSPNNTSATSPETRKTKYLSKYLVNWEKEANVRLCWLTKGRKEGIAYCLVCRCNILIKHMGKSAVMLHVKGKQHSNRIAQIETNLHFIKSGALQTHLNMSEYRIPAHEHSMSNRTQNTEIAMREQIKREQQEVTIPDGGRATDNNNELTARCNCGQTEKFFEEILNVFKPEEYMQMMSDQKYAAEIASQPNDVTGRMYDESVLHATAIQSLESSSITTSSDHNSISYDPSLSSEAYPYLITHQNAGQSINVEMANPDVYPTPDLVNSESTNATYLNKSFSSTDEARNTQTQYSSNPLSNQSPELELGQPDVDMPSQSFDFKPKSPSQ